MRLWTDAQTQVVMTAIQDASGGRPTLLGIEGAAGAGKTALLDALSDWAPSFQVLTADGLENDRTPFALFSQWGVDSAWASGAQSTPFVAAQALRARVDAIAAAGPVMIMIDDLHWVDPESVEALTWLLRRASGDRLLVVTGSRPLPPDLHQGWQRWAAGRGRRVHLILDGLSLADAHTLIRHSHPSVTGDAAKRLWEHTSGNPLYLTALISELDSTALEQLRELPAPAEFAVAVGERLARLTDEAVGLLRAVCVLGTGWVSLIDAASVAEVGSPTNAAQVLVTAGLLQLQATAGPASARVAHALVRAAVYRATPLPERRALHARAATVVTVVGAALEHRMSAAEQYDEELADAMESYAAELYGQASYRLAGSYLNWASALTRNPPLRLRRRLESLFYLAMANERAVVHAAADEVQRAGDAPMRALVLGTLAVWERRRHDGIELLAPIARMGIDDVDSLTRYRVEILLAWARMGAGDSTSAIAAGLARARGLAVRDSGLAGIEMVTSGQISLRLDGVQPSLAALQDLPARPASVPLAATNELAWRGSLLARLGLVEDAVSDLTEATRRIQDGATNFGAGAFHAVLGFAHWLRGEWSRARLNVNLALDMSGPTPHPMAMAVAPLADIGEGRFLEADRLLESAGIELAQNPWVEACDLLIIASVARLHAEGSDADRSHLLVRLRSQWFDSELASRVSPVLLMHVALAAIWAHELNYAEHCIDEMVHATPQAPWVSAAAQWLRGLIADKHGDKRAAFRRLTSSVTQGEGQLPLYHAHALVDHARIAGALGQERPSRESLKHAESLYREIRATWYVDKLANAQTSSRLGARTDARTLNLTERERDILTLVMAGLSYAQISAELYITQSTVSYHLSNVYGKAGVNSRHHLVERIRSEPGYLPDR